MRRQVTSTLRSAAVAAARIEACVAAGVRAERIVIDPSTGRKALIGKLAGAAKGCAWVPVHDVAETVQALKMSEAVA